MTARFTEQATVDIEMIVRQASATDEKYGELLSKALERTIERCDENPLANPRTRSPHVRRCPLKKYRYTIFYRIFPGEKDIEVMRVRHSARVRNLRRVPRFK
jgi:plasmid stabilization system protein ParE